MAVVINDFEVVLDAPATDLPPPATASATQPAGEGPGPGHPPMSPMDFEMLDAHRERRRERLRAH